MRINHVFGSILCSSILLVLFASAMPVQAQIGFDQLWDQPAEPLALGMFQQATRAECRVLQQYNPGITSCGLDELFRNPTLQAWGLSSPGPNLLTVTRYNPTALTKVLLRYGQAATFFVFAHEGGHHFDRQFNGIVPWQVPNYASSDYPLLPNVPPVEAYNWNLELRADAWGGCAVGATGQQVASVDALEDITKNIESPDVPPVRYTKKAIQAGYDACTHNHGQTNEHGQTSDPKASKCVDIDYAYADDETAWNKSPMTPTITYRRRYENDCDKAVSCKITVVVGIEERPGGDHIHWQETDRNDQTVTFSPNSTGIVSGILHWQVNHPPSMMPEIRFSESDDNDYGVDCQFSRATQ